MATRIPGSVLRLLAVLALAAAAATAEAATIMVINRDGPGVGFNDPTPAEPVGGNPGTTVGQQRLNVLVTAASIWGAILPSPQTIRVGATFTSLDCTSSTGILANCGPHVVFRDFVNAPFGNTWYVGAEADKLADDDLDSGVDDIDAQFNANVGTPGCMDSLSWYYGYDGQEGARQNDMLPLALHELAHGLGFLSMVDESSGERLDGRDDVFSRFLLDANTGLHWNEESNAQRAASAVSPFKVLWDGSATRFMSPAWLAARRLLRVNAPPEAAGDLVVGTATFGPALSNAGVTGDVALVDDGVDSTRDACTPLVNGAEIAGRIALVDRGSCTFATKVKTCQDAGATGVIVVNNVPGSYPPAMGGTDSTVTIPAVMVTKADGDSLKAHLGGGLNASLLVDPALRAGADARGRVMVYSPDTLDAGSSISHWDVSCTPNLLMEPFLWHDLTREVDLTRYVFEDMGWLPRTTGLVALRSNVPNPFRRSTTIRFEMPNEDMVRLDVFDVAGRLLRRLVTERLPAGSHAVLWDGTDSHGNHVRSGVYFSRLEVGGEAHARTLVLAE